VHAWFFPARHKPAVANKQQTAAAAVVTGHGAAVCELEPSAASGSLLCLVLSCKQYKQMQPYMLLLLLMLQGIGAAVCELEPSAVSGSLVCLLRELLGDVYADVRLTALQQVLPVGECVM
jgi:hypothetical protein